MSMEMRKKGSEEKMKKKILWRKAKRLNYFLILLLIFVRCLKNSFARFIDRTQNTEKMLELFNIRNKSSKKKK